jgi:hypothetical protein
VSAADLAGSLEDALTADVDPDFDTAPAPPSDTARANSMLRHVDRLHRRRLDVLMLAEAETERVDLWLSGELAKIDGQVAWFEQALAAWHEAVLRDDPKAVTISLPAGRHIARTQQPEWEIDDSEFLVWAAAHHPVLINPGAPKPAVPSVDRAAVKKMLMVPVAQPGDRVQVVDPESGEMVPGVTVTVRPRKYSIEAAT